MATQLQSIAAKVDEFSSVAKDLVILLESWDPAHAKLIEGVLGIVQKTAKTYERPDPQIMDAVSSTWVE